MYVPTFQGLSPVDWLRPAGSATPCFPFSARRLSFFKTGYDPEYSKYAPFKLLTYFTIRDGFSAGLREVDFLGDNEPWKLEWTSTTRPHDWLFVFGHSARGRLAHAAKCRVVPAIKRLLGR